MPTSAIATFGAGKVDPIRNPDLARQEVFNGKASTTFAKGTVVGEIAASPGTVGPYASGNVDGTQNPIGVVVYDYITDASGNVSLGTGITAGATEWGQVGKGIAVWTTGLFSCADLVGLDANAASKLGRLVRGTVTAGEVAISGG